MRKAEILSVAIVMLAAYSMSAEAKLYKWVDDKGATHYDEVVPPEYANKNQVQFSDKGREIKMKDAPKNATGKNSVTDQLTIDQQRRDKALVNTYSNEKEIDLARDRNLQQVEARINGIQLLQQSAQGSLEGYRKEAADTEKAGRKIPFSLRSDITASEEKIAKLKLDLAVAQEKEAAVRASFEADKVRYRELTKPPVAKK